MGFLDLLFPKICVGCHRPGSYLCSDCQKSITQKPLICPICFRPAIGGATHPLCTRKYGLDGLWSLANYQDPIRSLIHKLKYRFVREIAKTLVDFLFDYWSRFPTTLIQLLQKDRGEGWQIVPVPLHHTRQNWRGFNQAQTFAGLISDKLGIPINNCLIRTINTKPQFKLGRALRTQNTRHAFDLSMNYDPSADGLTQNVILVDDVWTTGSTLKSCAQILKRNGVNRVWALTIAR